MKKKVIAGLAVAAVMAVSSIAFTACGGTKTYSNSYAKAVDFATETYHTGYVSGSFGENASYVVTLEISGSAYTLTKEVNSESTAKVGAATLKFAFSGTCKTSGSTVTLSAPTQCEWSENWAKLAEYGAFANGSGTATSASDKTENGDVVFNLFNGEFLNLSTCAEQVVTVSESGTISFEE